MRQTWTDLKTSNIPLVQFPFVEEHTIWKKLLNSRSSLFSCCILVCAFVCCWSWVSNCSFLLVWVLQVDGISLTSLQGLVVPLKDQFSPTFTHSKWPGSNSSRLAGNQNRPWRVKQGSGSEPWERSPREERIPGKRNEVASGEYKAKVFKVILAFQIHTQRTRSPSRGEESGPSFPLLSQSKPKSSVFLEQLSRWGLEPGVKWSIRPLKRAQRICSSVRVSAAASELLGQRN